MQSTGIVCQWGKDPLKWQNKSYNRNPWRRSAFLSFPSSQTPACEQLLRTLTSPHPSTHPPPVRNMKLHPSTKDTHTHTGNGFSLCAFCGLDRGVGYVNLLLRTAQLTLKPSRCLLFLLGYGVCVLGNHIPQCFTLWTLCGAKALPPSCLKVLVMTVFASQFSGHDNETSETQHSKQSTSPLFWQCWSCTWSNESNALRFCCILPSHGLRGDWDGARSHRQPENTEAKRYKRRNLWHFWAKPWLPSLCQCYLLQWFTSRELFMKSVVDFLLTGLCSRCFFCHHL